MKIDILILTLIYLAVHRQWIMEKLDNKKTQNSMQVVIGGLFIFLITLSVRQFKDQGNELPQFFSPASASAEELSIPENSILETKCYACHGPRKAIANLRLDDTRALQTGDSPWIVPEDPEQSRLIRFLRQPPVDMKKREKHLLTEGEVNGIAAWIYESRKLQGIPNEVQSAN